MVNTREFINPKLWPGLTTYESFDEPIVIVINNELVDRMAPVMIKIMESIAKQEETKGA